MHKRERKNHQLLTSKGEIPEERQAENEVAQKAYDKLLTSTSTLAVSVCGLIHSLYCIGSGEGRKEGRKKEDSNKGGGGDTNEGGTLMKEGY